MAGLAAEEYYKNDYPDEESSECGTSEGSGACSHPSHYFIFPLEAAAMLAYLQTPSLTMLTIMTTTIGARAPQQNTILTGLFSGRPGSCIASSCNLVNGDLYKVDLKLIHDDEGSPPPHTVMGVQRPQPSCKPRNNVLSNPNRRWENER